MKKNLFIIAAATLAFAACTSDELKVNTDQQQVAEEYDGGVRFDTYVSTSTNGTTRTSLDGHYAGYGKYATEELQAGGFGVFAQYYSGDTKYASLANDKDLPSYNFMYNQLVTYNDGNWSYTPLLYWPNETRKSSADNGKTDEQTGNTATAPHLDRVSFFAYAPYAKMKADASSGLKKTDGKIMLYDAEEEDFAQAKEGNILMPKEDGTEVPFIKYVMSKKPKDSEDLLWAVAPYGGLKYTAVNGDQIDIAYGTSFVDLVKPAANTKIKFLFQHALTALKMSIVAAIDEVEPKGTTLDNNTKIYVNSITLRSNSKTTGFATQGTLSLLNRSNGLEPNLPNWMNTISSWDDDEKYTQLTISNNGDIDINPKLFSGVSNQKYADAAEDEDWDFNEDDIPGVNQTETDVFVKKDGFAKDLLMFIPVLPDTYKYNTAPDLGVTVTIDYDVVTNGSNVKGGYVVVNNKISKVISLPKYRNGRIYKLKLILGMTSVQLEAEANDWTEVGQEVDLPRNLD